MAEAASRLAGALGLRLVLAHTYPPVTVWAENGLARRYACGPLMDQWRAGLTRLESAAASLTDGSTAEFSVEPGDPTEELIRIATREAAELIVVGSRRQGTLNSLLHGSVACALTTSAPIPVLIVPLVGGRGTDEQAHDQLTDNNERIQDQQLVTAPVRHEGKG